VIALLVGQAVAIRADSVVILAGGVGYRVYTGPGTLASFLVGDTVTLHIHHLVREDQQALYGFRTEEELAFFELLTTVSGVGPKVGLAILASRPVADLQLAIVGGDEPILTAVSGVGKKLAARIILELREKVAAGATALGGGGGTGAAEGEVTGALQALGYSLGEAREAARLAVADPATGPGLEERVKAALRTLRRE